VSKKIRKFDSPPTLDPMGKSDAFEPRCDQRKRNIAELLRRARELDDRKKNKENDRKLKTSPLRLSRRSSPSTTLDKSYIGSYNRLRSSLNLSDE